LQAPAVKDLEGEHGGSEWSAEEHGEAGGHAADGDYASFASSQAQVIGEARADAPRSGHERRLGPQASAGTDAEQRLGYQGPQVTKGSGSALDMDVVDQELDIGRGSGEVAEQGDNQSDGHEDGE